MKLKKCLLGCAVVLALHGCASIENAMGRLNVKDYTAKSGQRVVAGQAEPKEEYNCKKLVVQKQDWGLTGNMDKVTAYNRVVSVAVETAPTKGANYAHIIVPSEISIMGLNVNAFRDARVAYYKCTALPAVIR